MGKVREGVQSGKRHCHKKTSEARLHCQLGEVTAGAIPEERMAGYRLGHTSRTSFSSSQQEKRNQRPPKDLPIIKVHDEKVPGENPREATTRFFSRPHRENNPQIPESLRDSFCQRSTERQAPETARLTTTFLKKMARATDTKTDTAINSTSPVSRRTHRCLTDRVGCTHFRRQRAARGVVTTIQRLSHKHLRINHSMASHKETAFQEEHSHQGTLRQHHSDQLPQQTGFGSIHSPQLVDSISDENATEEGALRVGLPRSRNKECGGRRPISECDPPIRMVSRQKLFQVADFSDSPPSSRPVCHEGKCSASMLYLLNQRARSERDECIPTRLDPVGVNLCVSPVVPDFEGFGEDEILQGARYSGHPLLAKSSMVPYVHEQVPQEYQDTRPRANTESGPRDLLLFIKSSPPPSRVDFMRTCYRKSYSDKTISVLLEKLRHSTQRQYETSWSSFVNFVKIENVSVINRETVCSFMLFLFETKKFTAHTVATYKAALKDPLSLGFDFDTSDEFFTQFIKGLKNRRPARPYRPVMWSLDKVLELLMSEKYCVNPSVELLLKKTIFLVALATGARVSEIHALHRDAKYISFTDEVLTLSFPTTFLCKNEDPVRRRPPITIRALFDHEGLPHRLCPVNSIRSFLAATSSAPTGKLFLDRQGPCSKLTVANHMCNLIKSSQPNAFPTSHQVRKMATSLAFLSQFTTEEVCNSVGWASPRVFYKHYLQPLQEVRHSCVLLGKAMASHS